MPIHQSITKYGITSWIFPDQILFTVAKLADVEVNCARPIVSVRLVIRWLSLIVDPNSWFEKVIRFAANTISITPTKSQYLSVEYFGETIRETAIISTTPIIPCHRECKSVMPICSDTEEKNNSFIFSPFQVYPNILLSPQAQLLMF